MSFLPLSQTHRLKAGSHHAASGVDGFTLVELLVTITIISVLLSLLLPSLEMAKEASRSLVCLNNLRQLSQAAHQYANDYDDCFPDVAEDVTYPGAAANAFYRGWDFPLRHYLANMPRSLEEMRAISDLNGTYPTLPFETRYGTQNIRYNRTTAISNNPFFCPSTTGGLPQTYAVNCRTGSGWGDYGMNVEATGVHYSNASYWGKITRSQIKNASRLMLFADMAGYVNYFYNGMSPSPRHMKKTRCNAVCVDGSAFSCRCDMDISDTANVNEIYFDNYTFHCTDKSRYKVTVVQVLQ